MRRYKLNIIFRFLLGWKLTGLKTYWHYKLLTCIGIGTFAVDRCYRPTRQPSYYGHIKHGNDCFHFATITQRHVIEITIQYIVEAKSQLGIFEHAHKSIASPRARIRRFSVVNWLVIQLIRILGLVQVMIKVRTIEARLYLIAFQTDPIRLATTLTGKRVTLGWIWTGRWTITWSAPMLIIHAQAVVVLSALVTLMANNIELAFTIARLLITDLISSRAAQVTWTFCFPRVNELKKFLKTEKKKKIRILWQPLAFSLVRLK